MKMDKKKILRILLMVSPFLAVIIFYVFYGELIKLVSLLPTCPFNRLGLLCPGCGNTRATIALMHGHLVESVCYNPSMLILAIFFAMFYIEQAAALLGKKIKLVPRSGKFYIVFGVIFALYCVLRNIPFFSWLTWISV